jgi:hypothetical protein
VHLLVSSLNAMTITNIIPEPKPRGKIKYLPTTNDPQSDCVSIFSRIVSPYSTLVVDVGKIILVPGQSIIVYLGGFLPVAFDSTKIAFGWWEENIYNCHNYSY